MVCGVKLCPYVQVLVIQKLKPRKVTLFLVGSSSRCLIVFEMQTQWAFHCYQVGHVK